MSYPHQRQDDDPAFFREPQTMKSTSIARRIYGLYRRWRRFRATEERRRILEPNMDSDVKIERYSFAVNKEITYGVEQEVEMSNSPDVTFRPQMLHVNVDKPGMFIIRDIRVANVSCLVGGQMDAYAARNGLEIDYPTITPANKVVVMGFYTGKWHDGWLLHELEERGKMLRAQVEKLRGALGMAAGNIGLLAQPVDHFPAKRKTLSEKAWKTIRTVIAKRSEDLFATHEMMLRVVRETDAVLERPEQSRKFTLMVAFTGPAGIVA